MSVQTEGARKPRGRLQRWSGWGVLCGKGLRGALRLEPGVGGSRPGAEARAGAALTPRCGAHLAETLVVKAAHSLAYTSLVVPVMSSHCAWSVPPATGAEAGQGTAFRGQTHSLPRCQGLSKEGQSRAGLCGPEHTSSLMLSPSLSYSAEDSPSRSLQRAHGRGKPKQGDGWLPLLLSPLNVARRSRCCP